MPDNCTTSSVMRIADLAPGVVDYFLARFGLAINIVDDGQQIPASFWGDSEAGVRGKIVFVRRDTPVHSLLHETCHIVCMDGARRSELHRDAGGDDLEEAAVCYLQIILAEHIPGVGRRRLMQDMDTWGYSFRLGSTAAWFEHDADDARQWLVDRELLDASGAPLWRLRDH